MCSQVLLCQAENATLDEMLWEVFYSSRAGPGGGGERGKGEHEGHTWAPLYAIQVSGQGEGELGGTEGGPQGVSA